MAGWPLFVYPDFPSNRIRPAERRLHPHDIEYLSKSQVDLSDQYADLGVDAAQLKRGIFFSFDNIGSNHFFDPEHQTDSDRKEYAVYTLFRDCEVQQSAVNFWEFVTQKCLGEGISDLIEIEGMPEQVFVPTRSK